ncbi:cation-translocating P-type ATPase [Pseudokordiimonas caeni]|uniref:cation-translocating P-type ATPase n=1 Tax=Pseudokordiimonas caeni TaxID=2997908 RepID=UPI0028128A0F|nr:cation-transporting P-type ATPase [Pseudokordiimonas caeni]
MATWGWVRMAGDMAGMKEAGAAVGAGGWLPADPAVGLSEAEAARRLLVAGPNELGAARARSPLAILAGQFQSLLVAMLAGAAGLSWAFGDMTEALAILTVVVINAFIGFLAESKATRAMQALRALGSTMTRVRREGRVRLVPAGMLVPGDIVLLEAGDVVTADLRLLECSHMQCDESLLTGESVAVDKKVMPADAEAGDRAGQAFKGTAVTRGSCVAVVTATGRATELGHIANLTESAEGTVSPLEHRLQQLTRQLLVVVLVLMAVLMLVGVMAGHDAVAMVKTGVALAVAAIPEGLPIVATLALARGMWKLAARNALIEKLSAVETLGSVTLIITDKTGTLTENRMTVTVLEPASEPGRNGLEAGGADAVARRAFRACALCYSGTSSAHVSDPMERALIGAAANAGVVADETEARFPRVEEHAFDPATRMMATVHSAADTFLFAVKGAPEAVLAAAISVAAKDGARPITKQDRAVWAARIGALAGDGMRVLALAEKTVAGADAPPFADLVFLGLVGLTDPPRADAAAAVQAAKDAGIRVVMATGDYAATGMVIARAVGIVEEGDYTAAVEGDKLGSLAAIGEDARTGLLAARVFGRMSPAQKLELIDLHQRAGAIVAMTGDGVNDAPALKKADVGVAMGERGTEVAKEAAAMVLQDDSFASIVVAIQQGRVIFSNIRKFVVYLLSCNVSEVLVVTVAIVAGLPLPLLPLQILFLNLITDVFPALALGFGSGDSEILHRPPRPRSEGLLQPRHWLAIGGYAALMTITVMTAFIWALSREMGPGTGANGGAAGTVAFFTLALAQLWHVFNMRSRKALLFRNQVVANPLVWGAIALCVALLGISIGWAPVREILGFERLDATAWGIVLICSLVPLVLGQAGKFVARIRVRPWREAP